MICGKLVNCSISRSECKPRRVGRHMTHRYNGMIFWAALTSLFALSGEAPVFAKEPLVIAASPSLSAPLEALGRAFEMTHPDVKVMLYFDDGLNIRRTIAAMENTPIGQYFIGKGPIHLIAPGGDELITRLQQRYYVLPDSRYPYATEPLTLILPE